MVERRDNWSNSIVDLKTRGDILERLGINISMKAGIWFQPYLDLIDVKQKGGTLSKPDLKLQTSEHKCAMELGALAQVVAGALQTQTDQYSLERKGEEHALLDPFHDVREDSAELIEERVEKVLGEVEGLEGEKGFDAAMKIMREDEAFQKRLEEATGGHTAWMNERLDEDSEEFVMLLGWYDRSLEIADDSDDSWVRFLLRAKEYAACICGDEPPMELNEYGPPITEEGEYGLPHTGDEVVA